MVTRCQQRFESKALGVVRVLEDLRQPTLGPRVECQRQRPEVGIEVEATDISSQPAGEVREQRRNGIHAHSLSVHEHHLARLNQGSFLLLADCDDFLYGVAQIARIEGFRQVQKDAASIQVVRQDHVVLRTRGQYDALGPADLQKRCDVGKGILLTVQVDQHDVRRPAVPARARSVPDRPPVDLRRVVDSPGQRAGCTCRSERL